MNNKTIENNHALKRNNIFIFKIIFFQLKYKVLDFREINILFYYCY